MKTKHPFALLAAFALTTFITPSLRANDDGNQGGNSQGENEGCQGGQIDGSETLIASVDLVATTNAPAGAGGFAKLISENEDGVVQSSFSLTITGLDAGVYTLSIVKKSDGSTNDVGQFQIGGGRTGGDDDGEGDDNQGGDGGSEKCSNNGTNGVVLEHVQLPDGVDPMDVGQILISDSNANVLLAGDLVNATGATLVKFRAALHVASGTASLQITGKARALSTAHKGRRSDRFTMLASGLAPNTIFNLNVNGQPAGTVKSNRKGNLLIHKAPSNLLTLRSVHLVDPDGQVVVRAKF